MISTLCKQIYTKAYIKHKKIQNVFFFLIFAKIKKFDSNFLKNPQTAPIMNYTRRIKTFCSIHCIINGTTEYLQVLVRPTADDDLEIRS